MGQSAHTPRMARTIEDLTVEKREEAEEEGRHLLTRNRQKDFKSIHNVKAEVLLGQDTRAPCMA